VAVVDLRDIGFLLKWLQADDLVRRGRFADLTPDDFRAILELAERISEDELASHLRASDLNEPRLLPDGRVQVLPEVAAAVRVMADAGLFSTIFDHRLGGLQLPHLVHIAVLGVLMSGNLATASFPLLTIANASLLATYGDEAQVAAFALPQIAGTAMGTMCLSEPHAGSSLADICTRAISDGEDGLGRRFRLFGAKMWISAGDHDVTDNIVHLVLAKAPEPDGELPIGSRGISLFVVPKILPDGQRNDVAVAGLNHKMGYRGLPNCALNFGEGRAQPDGAPGAVGWLLGEPGQGLRQMFHMMNEARVSVGLAATMLACRGYQMSLQYARERQQGRAPGVAPSESQAPIIQHADVKRMLLAQKAYSQGALGLLLFCARLIDDEKTAETAEARRDAGRLLALLTPLAKTWPSEWGQLSLHHALQIHGGAGYTRDFEIELLYRDNRLNPIHEGTTGIQGLDLVGRKLRRDRGEAFQLLAGKIRGTLTASRTDFPVLDAIAQCVEAALCRVEKGVATLLQEPDEARALAHGAPALFAMGHLVIGWIWLEQAIASERLRRAGGAFDEAFLAGRIRAARFFAEVELPKVAAWVAPIVERSDLVLTTPEDQF
jgi:alkylation response protein AidB-like acyl-CoA dehydrogenase